jgi:hypothetical protein
VSRIFDRPRLDADQRTAVEAVVESFAELWPHSVKDKPRHVELYALTLHPFTAEEIRAAGRLAVAESDKIPVPKAMAMFGNTARYHLRKAAEEAKAERGELVDAPFCYGCGSKTMAVVRRTRADESTYARMIVWHADNCAHLRHDEREAQHDAERHDLVIEWFVQGVKDPRRGPAWTPRWWETGKPVGGPIASTRTA